MTTKATYNALFICTGNSARSILAEGILNELGQGRFRAYSAGSQPKGEVHPLALATLERLHMPTTGYRSKSWDEFVAPGRRCSTSFYRLRQRRRRGVPVLAGQAGIGSLGRARSGSRRRQRRTTTQSVQGCRADLAPPHRAVSLAATATPGRHVAATRVAKHRPRVKSVTSSTTKFERTPHAKHPDFRPGAMLQHRRMWR